MDLELVQTTRNVNGTRHSVRKFQPGKRAHLFRFSTFLGIFQWNEPTKRVPFTAEPEIPEILTKRKAPCVSRLDALFLKSTVSFTLALRFFLSSLHWNMASLDFKGEIVPVELPNPGETQLRKGWKRTGTFPLTFTFADKHGGCNGNGLIDVAEKFEFGACSVWIVEDVGRGSFLFPCLVPRPHYYGRPMRFGSRGPRKFLRPRQTRRSETFCLT